MYLRRLTLRGFKSFPDRTRLEFAPGVSVVVGPNGSGKSNVTDAVLWVLGEQSPLAVRGSSMQDVIFAGGHGRGSAREAEVELVLDNGCHTLGVEFPEVSIVRRLDRAGEGEYRLNGARCRLVDVLEVLSDTGLGKEMHSVVSQGRVEAIVTSKPRDRRLLVEEAAGLGKHRKRRRRAQLKLERTQENLDRALDVEREARSRLKPLKRQAEAAELHARIERQSLEARWELARDDARAAARARAAAEQAALTARGARGEAERALAEVVGRRQEAEEALARRAERREVLGRRAYATRAAAERLELRLESARAAALALGESAARGRSELDALDAAAAADAPDPDAVARIAALEAERSALEHDVRAERERELAELEARRAAAGSELERREAVLAERTAAVLAAEARRDEARGTRRAAERAAEEARRTAARTGAELAAANQFLRGHAAGEPGRSSARTLAGELRAPAGLELALAAALGGLLGAPIVPDRRTGEALLDSSGPDGGSALVAAPGADPPDDDAAPPAPDARRLLDLVSGPADVLAAARPLLAATWIVDELADVPADFAGTAVTPDGRVWFGRRRELRRVPPGGGDRLLAERNRRDGLVEATEAAAAGERAALAAVEAAAVEETDVDTEREALAGAARAARDERDAAAEDERRAARAAARRREAPAEGPEAHRRAQVEAELAAERRLAERLEAERAARTRRAADLERRIAREDALAPLAARLADALSVARAAVVSRAEAFDAELAADRAAGESLAALLRGCAREEAEVQARLRARGEEVTATEVAAQRARDRGAEAAEELGTLAERLGFAAEPTLDPLGEQERAALTERIVRLARRRELLGPVNPLAQDEYAEAVAHVEELEAHREDLEAALRELVELIRDTDREIRRAFEETFTAAARNFEEVVEYLFPGGRGALRLVREDAGPRSVLGGAESEDEPAGDDEEEEEELGVEIEVTPAGKATKRLSLLSGGEKSLTALAFLFAVFLARPCPFYVLDEVEAALDDLNIGRFLDLLRRFADRAQFIVVTHQRRTMEAADALYGVSMAGDGVSRVVSRRLPREDAAAA